MNFDSPDVTATLNREAIDAVPVQNRRWSALAMTSPGVVADASGFGLVSVRGMSTLLNNVMIDGADDNQAYYSEERGRTREAYSTSENAVGEFDVNTGVYSAEYGRAAGGVINSVTRSGTNQLHGELFFNDLDRGFGAYVPGSVSATGTPLKPKDLRKIYGGSVGGALIKDKLFWFYTYDQHTHTFPAISRPRSYGSASTVGSFLEQPDATVTSCTENAQTGAVTVTGAVNHSALDSLVCALSFREKLAGGYTAGVTAYNAGVAALLTDVGTVPRVGYQEINTPKLDYQINPKERVSFLFHRLRWDAPGDVQTASAAFYSVDAFGTDFVKLDYGLSKLTSQITPRLTNEALYQYSRELDDEGQQPFSAYTLANLVATGKSASGMVNGPGGTIPYINLNQSNYGFYLGSPYYSYRQALPDERKWQITDTLFQSGGDHSIRYGIDILHNNDVLHQEPYYFGYYSYSNIANYLSDLANKGSASCSANGAGVGVAPYTTSTVNDTAGSYGCYSTISQDFGATGYEIATVDVAGFVQDNWKVNKQLTLELGLRYDVERLPAPSAVLTAATGSFVPYAGITNLPHDNNNFGASHRVCLRRVRHRQDGAARRIRSILRAYSERQYFERSFRHGQPALAVCDGQPGAVHLGYGQRRNDVLDDARRSELPQPDRIRLRQQAFVVLLRAEPAEPAGERGYAGRPAGYGPREHLHGHLPGRFRAHAAELPECEPGGSSDGMHGGFGAVRADHDCRYFRHESASCRLDLPGAYVQHGERNGRLQQPQLLEHLRADQQYQLEL